MFKTVNTLTFTLILTLFVTSVCFAESFITEVSYYTRASCIKESGQCTMASGKELVDYGQNIAASWDYPFGQRLRISNVKYPERTAIVIVSDRGPAKRLYRKGRRLDLNAEAFKRIAPLKDGLAICKVERIGG